MGRPESRKGRCGDMCGGRWRVVVGAAVMVWAACVASLSGEAATGEAVMGADALPEGYGL